MGVDEKELMLNLICRYGGGVTIHECIEETGLSYKVIVNAVRELINDGYRISGLTVGGTFHRFVLSPYDANYNELIKNTGGNEQ